MKVNINKQLGEDITVAYMKEILENAIADIKAFQLAPNTSTLTVIAPKEYFENIITAGQALSVLGMILTDEEIRKYGLEIHAKYFGAE